MSPVEDGANVYFRLKRSSASGDEVTTLGRV